MLWRRLGSRLDVLRRCQLKKLRDTPLSLPHTCTRICALQRGSREWMAPPATQRAWSELKVKQRGKIAPLSPPYHSHDSVSRPALSINTFLLVSHVAHVLFGKHGRYPSITVAPSDVPKRLTDVGSPGTAVGKKAHIRLFAGCPACSVAISELTISNPPTSEGTFSVGHVDSMSQEG